MLGLSSDSESPSDNLLNKFSDSESPCDNLLNLSFLMAVFLVITAELVKLKSSDSGSLCDNCWSCKTYSGSPGVNCLTG